MNFDELEIAAGVVEFSVWAVNNGEIVIVIDGNDRWRRPVIGLIPRKTGEGKEPVVLAETGEPKSLREYLDGVIARELQREHSTAVYLPGIDGPLGNAPRITRPGSP